MSRTKLDRAISELESSIAEPLMDELNWLTNEIHLLDHKKGEAEAQKARATLEAQNEEEKAKGLELVKKLERQHDKYVDGIGALRNRVLSEMDKVIADLIEIQGIIATH